jgi:hypothetical protein
MSRNEQQDHSQRQTPPQEVTPSSETRQAIAGREVVRSALCMSMAALGTVFGSMLGAVVGFLVEEKKTQELGAQDPNKQAGDTAASSNLIAQGSGLVGSIMGVTVGAILGGNPSADVADTKEAGARAQGNEKTREGCLTRQESGKIVRLKNGAQIEEKRGWECLNCLRTLAEDEPEHFQTLLSIARENSTDVNSAHVKILIEDGFLTKCGSIHLDMRDVLFSAYQETNEGPIVANPFKLTDVTESHRLEADEEERYQAFRRKVIGKMREQDDKGRFP